MKFFCNSGYIKLFFYLFASSFFVGICAAKSEFPNLQDELSDVVRITTYKNPDRRNFKAFIRALDANEKLKALAPNAKVNFQLVSLLDKNRNFQNTSLRIVSDNLDIPILLSEKGFFQIDKNIIKEAGEIELLVPAKSGTTKFEISVRTPGLPENERRLGDLRLECEMNWAMNREDLPFVMRATLSIGGGPCHSSKFAFSATENKEFTAVWLIESDRKLSLPTSQSNKRYLPPIYDESWGNDAKLIFYFGKEGSNSSH